MPLAARRPHASTLTLTHVTWLRRNAWWLVPELVAIVALGFAVTQLRPSRLETELAQRVAMIVERVPPSGHQSHGHQVQATDRLVCAAETLRFEPGGADRMEDVTLVYAYYVCAVGTLGTAWADSRRIDGPVAVRFGRRTNVQFNEVGPGKAGRVTGSLVGELRRRYATA